MNTNKHEFFNRRLTQMSADFFTQRRKGTALNAVNGRWGEEAGGGWLMPASRSEADK